MFENKQKFDNLVFHRHALQLQDKISCIHLLWTGETFRNMPIYIDLVPAFVLPPDFRLPRSAPLVKRRLSYHVIAKKSRRNMRVEKEDCLFAFSFALDENEFIRNLPVNIRDGFKLAKAVRVASISRPTDLSGLHLDDADWVDTDDVIKTYMLKTCLMFCYNEHKDDKNVLARKARDWTMMIYVKLLKFVEEERQLPTFYGDGVLFQCDKDHTEEGEINRACCLKRKLICRIADTILSWLHYV